MSRLRIANAPTWGCPRRAAASLPAYMRSRSLRTCGRWAFALGVLAIGLMQRSALAGPRACIPPGNNAQCTRDSECCAGSVCAGVCKRGCKINKVFFANGAVNPNNDCQWCQGTTNRFGWTNRVSGEACGDQTLDECTNPDTCDGSGACLANHEPTTSTCGDADTECMNQDYCDGSGGCTDNEFKPDSTSCTGASQDDQCDDDAADHCTGIDDSCVDAFKDSGTLCGDSGTQCRNQDMCDGLGGDCLDNGFKFASTSCTGASQGDECDDDPADHCTGSSNTCVDEFKANGTFCGDSGTQCRNQDTCDGLGGDCIDNGFKSSTTSCTGASQGDECDDDPADHCTGSSNSCVDMFKASGTSCGSNSDTDCDNPDTCNASGVCQTNREEDDTACTSDSNDCTDDVCDSGVCTHPNKLAGTACGSNSDTDCDNPDTCDGSGICQVNTLADGTACTTDGIACTSDVCAGGACTHPIAPASTHCTGTANGGPCDNDAADHCTGTSNACVDAFKPSSHACVLLRDANGNYACREVAYCTGTNSTCPTPDINVFDPSIPCRETGFSNHPTCDPPEYCSGYGQCAPPQLVDATCDEGPRDGQWCDYYAESVLGQPQCGDGGSCVKTVCRQGTGCERPWTCVLGGRCQSDGFLPAGTDCLGDHACEKYSCDAAGNGVDQNVTRSPSASCRPPANECDQRDLCGNPLVVPSNGRSDFDDYPNCGPDEKKPWGTACTYHPLGEDAPGRCSGGECVPYYCKNSIECPDGWVCGCPPGQVCPTSYCVPAPAEGGYGDVCAVRGYCSRSPLSWDPGRRCTSNADCSDVNHQGICHQSYCDTNSAFVGDGCASDAICQVNDHPAGKCVADTQGDCGSIPGSTFDYVCCAGMAGDGLGGRPALGVTGRCQECCGSGRAPDQNCTDQDATDGSTAFQCCDGKCTDVVSDIHNCVSCNYDGSGYDCTDLISACSPGVAECDAINIGSGCVMTEYCAGTVQQEGWIAASCDIPQVRVPVPDCDYCVFPSSTPGNPCLTDAECGGFPGSCYHDPSLFCFARTRYAFADAPECRVAPFTGCTPICSELDNAPNVGDECEDDRTCNESGDVCETDADCPDAGDYCIHECHGGTTCKTSCDLSQIWDIAFCFENPTCQW